MLAGILIEKIAALFIEDEFELFGNQPEKDAEGYICLRFSPSYYTLSILIGIVTVVFFYLVSISPPGDFWLGISVTSLFGLSAVLCFFYVKNFRYRFNDKEIVRRNLFRRETVLFWNNCNVKPLHPVWQQITLYNHEHRFRVYHKMIGFRHLVEMTGRKLNKSRVELGL